MEAIAQIEQHMRNDVILGAFGGDQKILDDHIAKTTSQAKEQLKANENKRVWTLALLGNLQAKCDVFMNQM